MSRKEISNFNRDEEFDYKNIPHHFESVSKDGLKQIEHDCTTTLGNKFGGINKPSAIKAMLGIIYGKFDTAYAELEGDYNARKTNLDSAYAKGLKDLSDRISLLEANINAHNLLYEQYSESMFTATGKRPNSGLRFSDEELKNLKKEYQELKKA